MQGWWWLIMVSSVQLSAGTRVSSFWTDLFRIYYQRIVATGREPQVFVLASFLVTIALARLAAHGVRHRWPVLRDVRVRGVHVHHFVPGIVLLLITGYLAIAIQVQSGRRVSAVGFGVGAGLTLDEFALWLHLDDVYWTDRGKSSFVAVLVVSAAAGLVLLGLDFWSDVLQRLTSMG